MDLWEKPRFRILFSAIAVTKTSFNNIPYTFFVEKFSSDFSFFQKIRGKLFECRFPRAWNSVYKTEIDSEGDF